MSGAPTNRKGGWLNLTRLTSPLYYSNTTCMHGQYKTIQT